MSLQDRYIEQCTAEEVLSVITDNLVQNPVSRTLVALNAMDPDIAEGKQNMAAAINTKYPSPVASANQSLNQMAKEVRTIAQNPIYIDGGKMYAAQLTGDGTLWDLYQVLNDMKNTFLQQPYGNNDFVYKCLIVAEYYKGNDSMQLRFADGYYTSDGVYYNEAQHLHPWNDANDGKANRWVCFLYKSEAPSITFDSNSTDISPRSMYIGGHIGTIAYQANGRLTELVSGIQETDKIDKLLINGYSQEWGFNTILRNVGALAESSTQNNGAFECPSKGTLIIEGLGNWSGQTGTGYNKMLIGARNATFIKISGKSFNGGNGRAIFDFKDVIELEFSELEEFDGGSKLFLLYYTSPISTSLQRLYMKNLKRSGIIMEKVSNCYCGNLIDVWVGALETNCNFNGWNASNIYNDPDKKAMLISNIVNHILARVSDRSETTFLNFTVGTNMCNAIKDELVEWPIGSGTQMTLYNAFQTKGWNLLGA